jgi:hypothetical protein
VRFSTLFHHVTTDRLSDAVYAFERKATPGADEVT